MKTINRGISIIIPCFNNGIYAEQAIKSVLAQRTKIKVEVILVDDGSTEGETLRVLENLVGIKKIRYEINKGVQYARNVGIKHATFDYIMTLDADDLLNTDCEDSYLDKAYEILESNENIAFVHGLSRMFGNFEDYTISAYPITEQLVVHKHHVQTSIIYRKSDAMNSGLYNEKIKKWQDWSFAVSLLNYRLKNKMVNEIGFLNMVYHLYRIHNNPNRISVQEMTEYEMTKITVENNIEIFKKYYPQQEVNEIVNLLLKNKPTKLVDLLYVAANDIDRALIMAYKRGARYVSDSEPHNIP